MANEQVALELWADHITEPSERTLEALVLHYAPLAKFLARRAKMRAPAHQAYDDLLSFAYDGLLDAIRKFDYTLGIKFDTYATRRITGAVIDGQRKLDPLSRRQRGAVKEYESCVELLELALGRPPTLQELAEALGTGVDDVRLRGVMRQSLAASVDDLAADLEHAPRHDQALTEHGAEEVDLRRGEIVALLARAIPKLAPRDRALLILYYVEGQSYDQIGTVLGLRENRCRQIRKDILKELVGA